jgi:DNA topoisomerase-1
LSLPREVGRHPEDGELIKAGIGRFGPYIQHGKTYASLEPGDDIFHIGLNRAVTLIAEKIAKGPRRRFGADPGRALGDHPTRGGPIAAKNGRYGPYVSHEGVNATLPSDKTPETITLEEAAALIDARAARNGPAPHARPRKAKPPSPGTTRHIKASSKRPGARAVKRPAAGKAPRKSTQAAE